MSGKRSAGEGYIKRLPSGTWFASVMDGWNDDGTRRRRSFSAPSKAELLDKINTFRLDQKAYLAAEAARKKTFAAWADSWYESYQTQVQPSTYCSYGYTLAILKQYFGEMSISSIKTMQINAFLNELTVIMHNYICSISTFCTTLILQHLWRIGAKITDCRIKSSKQKWSFQTRLQTKGVLHPKSVLEQSQTYRHLVPKSNQKQAIQRKRPALSDWSFVLVEMRGIEPLTS